MTRLPYLDPEAASPPVAEALDGVPLPLNVFYMVANAETAFRPWLRLGAAILGELALAPQVRELAVLEVARLSGCEYERVQHEAIAQALGVTVDEIRAIAEDDHDRLPGDARAVVRFTGEVVRDVRASDGTLAAVREVLPPREVVELLLVIGHYMSIARIAETAGIELDEPAQLAVVQAAGDLGQQA